MKFVPAAMPQFASAVFGVTFPKKGKSMKIFLAIGLLFLSSAATAANLQTGKYSCGTPCYYNIAQSADQKTILVGVPAYPLKPYENLRCRDGLYTYKIDANQNNIYRRDNKTITVINEQSFVQFRPGEGKFLCIRFK